jgi:hypothetical protein
MVSHLQRLKIFLFYLLALLFPQVTNAAIAPVQDNGKFADLSQLTNVFANVTSVVATLAGFAVLIMLIRGGVAYITAQGDPKALQTARGTITWAIIGLVVILAAYLIIALIAGFVTIPGLGKFCLPTAGQNVGECSP